MCDTLREAFELEHRSAATGSAKFWYTVRGRGSRPGSEGSLCGSMVQMWEIVGGGDKGGIIVRPKYSDKLLSCA